MEIYNIKGQKVKQLADGKFVSGSHLVEWNGKDNADKQVSSGIYFYKLSVGNKSIRKKMILLK